MHWTRRVGFLCLGLVSLGLARVALGQDNIAVNDGGVVYLDDFSGSVFLSRDGGNYLLFHKVVGEGVGHDVGYTRLGARTRLWEGFDQHLFGELHALITDDSRVGFNAGGGYRKQSGGGILGVHGWYDDYESARENRYRQITGGVEYLHPTFDVRANGYIPINERENFIGISNAGTDVSFLGNNIVTAGTVSLERAFYGWDLEGGGPVPLAENWLRAYAGVYQLLFDEDTTTGFRARAEARFMEGVNLNLVLSDDDKFGTNLNLGVEVRFRGTMPTRFASGYLADRRYDQVRRVWPVQTHVDQVNQPIPLNNPGTNDPIQIVFIDNRNPGGTGTFEDPLGVLPDGNANADIFLVNTGSGSTLGNITLQDGQQLLGAGKTHIIDTDRLGMIQLPDEFNQVSGNFPILEAANTALPIVTLANDNVVSGFNLRGIQGIVGGNVNNFQIDTIRSNTITDGILIQNGTGTGIVRDINFELMAGGGGVVLGNSTPGTPLNLAIDDVVIDGGAIGVQVAANGGDVTYDINNVTAANTTLAGLALVGTNAALNGTVDGTVVDDNLGNGVLIDLTNTTGRSTLTGLQASDNGTLGMELDGVRIIASSGSNYIVDILDSTINGAMDDGIDSDSLSGSTLTVNVDPTTLINSGDNAFEFLVSGNSTLNAVFDEVDMTGALNDAINGMVITGSTANLTFTRFDASGAVNDGLDIVVDGSSTLIGSFVNTDLLASGSFSNSGSSSVNVAASNNSVVDLTFTDITADNLSADGNVNLIANSGSQVTSNWTNGSISNGLANGVTLAGQGAGTQISATFNNVPIINNIGDGINASLVAGDSNSALDVTLNDVTLTGNADGLDFLMAGTDALGTVVFNNANLSFNLEDAFQFDITGGAILNASTTALSTNDFSNSGSNAFQGTVAGFNSLAIVDITDAPASNSGEEGALFSNANGGMLAFTYTNGNLSQSGFDGLSTTTTNGSLTGISLNNVLVNDNGQAAMAPSGDGIVATVDTNSRLNLMLNDVTTSRNAGQGISLTASNSSIISSGTNTGLLTSEFNNEEGLFFDVTGGSVLSFLAPQGSTSFNGVSGNLSGVRGRVDGANSAATVSFESFTSDFNTQDGFEFDVTNGGMLIAEIITSPTGLQQSSASNNTGAGISMNSSGAGTVASLIMDGRNLVNGNGEDGLVVNANGGDQLAIQATGQFNGNMTGYGIQINSTNVGTTAIEIGDATTSTMIGNALGGLEINLDNTILDDLPVTTLTQTEIVESFAITNFDIINNLGHGILVDATDVTLTDGLISGIDADFNFGDGIGLFFDNSTINGLVIENNGAQMNLNNGINLDLSNGTVADGVNINNNVGAPQNLGIEFLVDGNLSAQPFTITNVSDPGLVISNIVWDLTPIPGNGPVFNTTGNGSMAFAPLNFTNFFTGLNMINGVNVPPFNIAVPDNSQFLSMDFTNFDPNEALQFAVGMAPSPNFTGNIFGDDLIGSTVTVDFANGAQVSGTLDAVLGNSQAAMFNATTVNQVLTGLLDNGEDGLRIHVDNSTLSNSTVSGNMTNNNGSNGIEVLVENGSVIDNLNINGTEANNNVDEGILVTLNNSTVINGLVIDGSQVDDSNGPNNIALIVDGTTADSIILSNSLVQNSPNEGILVLATNSAIDNLILDGNSVLDSLSDGVRIDLINSAIAGTLAYNNGTIVNSGGNGLLLNLQNTSVGRWEMVGNNAGSAFQGGIIDVDFTNLIWTTFVDSNNSAGLDIASFTVDLRGTNRVWRSDQTPFNNRFEVTGNSGVTVGLNMVNGVNVNPATNPLQDPTNNNAVLVEGGVATGSQVVTFNFNDFNPGERFDYSLAHSAPNQSITGDITGAIGTVTLTDGRTASAIAQNSFGFNILQSFAATFGGISSNAGSGLVLNASNGSNIGEIFMDDNLLQENALNGMEFNIANSTLPAPGSESVISNTTIAATMGGDAFVMQNPDTNGTDFALDFVNNTFTSNIGNAINIALDGNSGRMTSNLSGNTITDNIGFGIRIDAIESSGVDLTVGDSTGNANLIQRNENAGVAITLAGTTTSSIQAENTTITNSVVGSDANFAGEGLVVRLTDMASLTNSNIGDVALVNTSFNENAGDGVQILANLDSTLTNLTLQNFTSQVNRGDGVNILREGTAAVDNIQILGANVSNNVLDGIDIAASLANLSDEYVIANTIIDSNGGRGLSLEARIDADIMATITDTTITNNGNDGLSITQVTNSIIDTPTVNANISGGSISSNTGFGIDITANHVLTVDDVTINANRLGGINIAGTGLLVDSITNSRITGNGNFETGIGDGIIDLVGADTIINNNVISNNAGNGVALTNGSHVMNSNVIEMNGFVNNPNQDTGDGVQLISNENGGLTLQADGNQVRNNRGRGVNLLVQGNTLADVTFNNGRVEGNMEEGFYIVTTTSLTRSVDQDATAANTDAGDLFANPILDFTFDANQVLSNGLDTGFAGAGLVMRIGTSGASTAANSFTDDGGFVSVGGALTGRGGVLASITNSDFRANPGEDILIESFDSTVNPATTTGVWNAANFNITSYVQDPLARLDLEFTGNTGDDADVVRLGVSFNNNEAVFKSRTTGQTPAGPFLSGTRLRNAQRLAARGGLFDDPALSFIGVSGDSRDFLYSGVGESTFRITNGSTTAGFTGTRDDFNSMLQLGVTNNGELPFTFGLIP